MSRTYLVTGANRGIGLEFTEQLITAGHTVIATTRSKLHAKALEGVHRAAGDRLEIVELDTTSQASVNALETRLGVRAIDTLINNAGVGLDFEAPLEEASLDAVRVSFETNALGPMRVTQALLPLLRRATQPIVVNISSLMGSIDDNKSGRAYGYRMSKAALNMFTKTLARDFPEIISVCLHPGWVQTEMGGENALITPEESVHGMLKVIQRLRKTDSGSFIDFRDQARPW